MKRNKLFILMLLLCFLCAGCGKKKKKEAPKPTEAPGEEIITLEPTPEPVLADHIEQYAGMVTCTDAEGGKVWRLNGNLVFTATSGGIGAGNSWETEGQLSEYVVTNETGTELFRVRSEEGASTSYVLSIGGKERNIASAAKSDKPSFRIDYGVNRMLFSQNGTPLFLIAAEADEMILSVADGSGAVAYRFPVLHFAVQPASMDAGVFASEGRLLKNRKEPADIYDGTYLHELIQAVRDAQPYKEWPAEAVEITEKRVAKGGSWTDYHVAYRSDSVVINRVVSSAPTVAAGYVFTALSEGIPTVEYYTFTDTDDILEYVFETEELDGYRTAIFEEEYEKEKKEEAFLQGAIPFDITFTDFGFAERGTCDGEDGRINYIRFCLRGDVTGWITAKYSDESGQPVSVRIDGLGDAEGNVYADGVIIPGTKPDRQLHLCKYDEYGVIQSETEGNTTVTYQYMFSDIAFDGEDDTVRHEWQKLMPYLETAPKVKPADKDDGEDGEDGRPDGGEDGENGEPGAEGENPDAGEGQKADADTAKQE